MVVEKIDLFFIEKLNKRDYQFKPAGWFFYIIGISSSLSSGSNLYIYNDLANWSQNIVAGGENASRKIVTSIEN